ncbi:MAG: Brp/Blh family beta-carotene 15,15'-dioxygenase, partial [Halobaculum sp.]
TVVVRGGLPMLVPLVFYPAEYRRVAAAAVGLFADADRALAPLFTVEARLAAGVGFGVVTLAVLAAGGWRVRQGARRRSWLVDAGETVLLWAYFALVPPILGIGLYFCFWHATRHLARLALVDGETPDGARAALTRGELSVALWRLARDATPMTLGGLAIVGALFLVVPDPATNPDALLAVYLVGIAVLTLPHVAVVTWMDRRQNVW